MLEHDHRSPVFQEAKTSAFIIRKVIPHRLTMYIADKLLGEGLTDEGHRKLKDIVGKILRGEHISASREMPQVYEDSDFVFTTAGEENIPSGGATLFMGNHTSGGPLFGMGQYFEVSRSVYRMRINVESEGLREPVAIAQRGLTKVTKLPGGRKIVWNIPLTGQFYDLAAECLSWATVLPPKFDAGGQIVNKQKLPKWVVNNLVAGGALLWLPQGKHQDVNDLTMPEKSAGLLTKLKDEDVNLVAVRFVPGNNSLQIFFSRAVHIEDVPQKDGVVDIGDFINNYMQRLGEQ
ncbi:hypothetical protein A2696_01245 [Candidatus Curtissbacteria bacterium RIFCSPHIGHO2_01_FULL_41_13]|uniref:Phospholipid/glycerol acyltransferase domain-containing protein n=1 Tax=Candidatus Curtissbacteria bacterium RIFCSPHIGHO2_01_FULL_41_13 TaxID=1797745 RepID=A0A1F5G068_9BACT|nr:MAG: hypothetical protein A2696_01245 [Candidatus Curtissbacteria bacterium RIFCSPHIGHO2_01_FULL_41_13]